MDNQSNMLHINNSLITDTKKKFITCEKRNYLCIMFLAIAISLAGCAGTAGRHRALMPMTIKIDEYTDLVLTSKNVSEVNMLDIENQRILATIVHKIRMENRGRFTHIKSDINSGLKSDSDNDLKSNSDSSSDLSSDSDSKVPNTLRATLIFTRYEKGNAQGRYMMAGFGAIHIDANLELADEVTQKVVGKYEIKKTFAWGGIYGGSVTIEDAEDGFADAVVEALLEEQK